MTVKRRAISSLRSLIASLPSSRRRKKIERLQKAIPRVRNRHALIQALEDKYEWKPREAQKPPPGDWRVWLLLAGRGFGKTRSGAEFVRARVEASLASRVALVGPTAADVRDVMIEGESGLLAIAGEDWRPLYEPSKRRLTWPNGAVALAFSAD